MKDLCKESEEMQFWTKEEYQKFAAAIMDKPMSYYAFEMLYWCGIREGGLLALTPGDFDFKNSTVSINKSYQAHGFAAQAPLYDRDRRPFAAPDPCTRAGMLDRISQVID